MFWTAGSILVWSSLLGCGVLEEQVQNLKLTVHRLSVELSRYQAQTRPLGQQQEEVTALRVRVEVVVTENQTLHDRLVTSKGVSQQDWCGLQEKAALVLKENQVLLDQLEAQQKLSQTSHRQHQTEVTRLTKRVDADGGGGAGLAGEDGGGVGGA
ncbi:unnamed protein product [Boreogadus saida]